MGWSSPDPHSLNNLWLTEILEAQDMAVSDPPSLCPSFTYCDIGALGECVGLRPLLASC